MKISRSPEDALLRGDAARRLPVTALGSLTVGLVAGGAPITAEHEFRQLIMGNEVHEAIAKIKGAVDSLGQPAEGAEETAAAIKLLYEGLYTLHFSADLPAAAYEPLLAANYVVAAGDQEDSLLTQCGELVRGFGRYLYQSKEKLDLVTLQMMRPEAVERQSEGIFADMGCTPNPSLIEEGFAAEFSSALSEAKKRGTRNFASLVRGSIKDFGQSEFAPTLWQTLASFAGRAAPQSDTVAVLRDVALSALNFKNNRELALGRQMDVVEVSILSLLRSIKETSEVRILAQPQQAPSGRFAQTINDSKCGIDERVRRIMVSDPQPGSVEEQQLINVALERRVMLKGVGWVGVELRPAASAITKAAVLEKLGERAVSDPNLRAPTLRVLLAPILSDVPMPLHARLERFKTWHSYASGVSDVFNGQFTANVTAALRYVRFSLMAQLDAARAAGTTSAVARDSSAERTIEKKVRLPWTSASPNDALVCTPSADLEGRDRSHRRQAELLQRLNGKPLHHTRHCLMPLTEIVKYEELNNLLGLASGYTMNTDPIPFLRNHPGICEHVEQTIKQIGIPAYALLSRGGKALVLALDDKLLIRVRVDDAEVAERLNARDLIEPERVQHPAIMQPIAVYRAGPMKIEIIPRLDTKNVREEHVAQIADVLTASGLILPDIQIQDQFGQRNVPGDVRVDNIGLLPDGTPILFDSECVKRRPGWINARVSGDQPWHFASGNSKEADYRELCRQHFEQVRAAS